MQDSTIFTRSSRRDWLRRMGGGFGSVGLAAVLADQGLAATRSVESSDPLAPRSPHYPARARRVIFLFMNGGPSHVDTFDPKPALAKHNGERSSPDKQKSGRKNGGTLMGSPFSFSRYGESGIEVSEL